MTRKTWGLALASVLVLVILLYSHVVATDADGRKKIAVFLDRTPLDMQQQAVVLSKSTVVSHVKVWPTVPFDLGVI